MPMTFANRPVGPRILQSDEVRILRLIDLVAESPRRSARPAFTVSRSVTTPVVLDVTPDLGQRRSEARGTTIGSLRVLPATAGQRAAWFVGEVRVGKESGCSTYGGNPRSRVVRNGHAGLQIVAQPAPPVRCQDTSSRTWNLRCSVACGMLNPTSDDHAVREYFS